jgi:hypothetical protein
MIPGFTAESACGPTSSYRGFRIERVPTDGSVLPQASMTIPIWNPTTGWGVFTVDLPDDPHGRPSLPVDHGTVQCRARCYRIANLATRRACLAEC